MASLLLLVAFASVQVQGTSTCPTPDLVSARLGELAPLRPSDERAVLVAQLEEDAESLRISLQASDGAAATERTLSRAGTCEDMASAAAVILATMASELPVGELTAPVLPSERPPSHLAWELGAGAVVSASRGVAFGAELVSALGPAGAPLSARLELTFLGARALALGPGEARWQRLWLGLGPRLRPLAGGVRLDLHVEVLAAVLFLSGSGFSVNASAADFDPGAAVGATLSTSVAGLAPFASLKAVAWVRPQAVGLVGFSESAFLPRFEGLLAVGVTFEGG